MDRNIKKVLIVEDEAIIARNLSQLLQRMGFEPVATISKGRKVVDAVKHYMPDIILMDILLDDDIDGITAAGAVRAFSDTPVIFITSNIQPEFADQAISENPFGYIIKPFRESEIKYAIMLADQKIAMLREMKKNQIMLKELKEFYNTILSSMTDWVIVANSNSDILFTNESFNNTFRENNLLAAFKNFMHEEFNNKSGLLKNAFTSGKIDRKEVSLENSNGKISTYSVSASPISAEDGSINMALMSGRDISELIEQRESLTTIKEILDSIVQTVPIGVIVTDSQGIISLTNKTFETMSGFTSTDLEGKNITLLQYQSSRKNLLSDNSLDNKNYIPVEIEFAKAETGSFTSKTIILKLEKPLNENYKIIFFVSDISFEKKLEIKQVRLQNQIESITREMDELSELLLETNVYNQSIKRGNIEFDSIDRNILKLIESGMPNNQIAARLGIAEITVKKRLSGIYSKLDIKNKYQLIEYLHTNFVPDK